MAHFRISYYCIIVSMQLNNHSNFLLCTKEVGKNVSSFNLSAMFYQNFNFHSKVTKIKLSFIFKNVLNPPHFQKHSNVTLNVLSGSNSPVDNSNDKCYCSHTLSVSFRYKSILNIYYLKHSHQSISDFYTVDSERTTVIQFILHFIILPNIIIEIQHIKLIKEMPKNISDRLFILL